MEIRLHPITEDHWPEIERIYLAGIALGHATFETQSPGWEKWDGGHTAHSRLAAFDGQGGMLGWAALSPVSGRCVYAGVCEVSVYVDPQAHGKGIGKKLLAGLIASSEKEGTWTLQAGIFPENEASVKLHTSCGFRIVGRREKLGKMNGHWRDVLLLERRSTIVETD